MPTIKDVAEACGVSQTTVSEVLNNGRRPVHAGTRARVLEAARTLDYRPSAIARGLAKKRMNTLGLAFPHGDSPMHNNPFALGVLDGVLAMATRHHQSIMLCTSYDWDSVADSPALYDGRCDGVLLLVPPSDGKLAETLLQRKVPFVLVSQRDLSGRMTCVDIDNISAAFALTASLLEMGHHRIAFVGQKSDQAFAFFQERWQGYRQAMDSAGITHYGQKALSPEDVLEMSQASANRLTALFCSHDAIALSLLEAMERNGIRVPQDMSVVGFDDISEAAGSQPPLTTMRQPMAQIGMEAAERLLALIDGREQPGQKVLLPTELIVRQSAAPPCAAIISEADSSAPV